MAPWSTTTTAHPGDPAGEGHPARPARPAPAGRRCRARSTPRWPLPHALRGRVEPVHHRRARAAAATPRPPARVDGTGDGRCREEGASEEQYGEQRGGEEAEGQDAGHRSHPGTGRPRAARRRSPDRWTTPAGSGRAGDGCPAGSRRLRDLDYTRRWRLASSGSTIARPSNRTAPGSTTAGPAGGVLGPVSSRRAGWGSCRASGQVATASCDNRKQTPNTAPRRPR